MIGFRANVLDAIAEAEMVKRVGGNTTDVILSFLGSITDRTVSVERLMEEVEECE